MPSLEKTKTEQLDANAGFQRLTDKAIERYVSSSSISLLPAVGVFIPRGRKVTKAHVRIRYEETESSGNVTLKPEEREE